MQDIAFMVFSGASLILVLLPMSWYVRARNVGTLAFIFWVWFGNLFFFVNSIIWYSNVNDPAPVWCDISAKFQIGISVGIPAACLCVNRRLFKLSTNQTSGLQGPERKWYMLQEVAISLGLPALVMILHYIVQGHRYILIEGVGCWADTYWSWPAVWLVLQWPFTIGLTSLGYGGIAFISFLSRHKDWNSNLKNKSLGMNKSRYIRLMILACGELAFTLPITFWVFYLSTSESGIYPWISWDYVHYDWYTIPLETDFVLEDIFPVEWTLTDLSRWGLPISAIVFFVLFGLSGEAFKEYKAFFEALFRRLRIPLPLERDLEAAETFSQFEKRYVIDLPSSRRRPDEAEDDDHEAQATLDGSHDRVHREERPLHLFVATQQQPFSSLPSASSAQSSTAGSLAAPEDLGLAAADHPQSKDAIAPRTSVVRAITQEVESQATVSQPGVHICCRCHLPTASSLPNRSAPHGSELSNEEHDL